jgi:hypothetical protein
MSTLTPDHERVLVAAEKLQLARAKAIQSYASLEQVLCELFSYASETIPPVAGTIYFKITASRTRLDILDKLMKIKHKSTYALFFNSMRKMVDMIERNRNEIVHWHMLGVGDEGSTGRAEFREMVLFPPNFWIIDQNTPRYTIDDLLNFKSQCDFLGMAVRMFVDTLNNREFLGRPPIDPGIFQRALEYPPSADHPLAGIRPTSWETPQTEAP